VHLYTSKTMPHSSGTRIVGGERTIRGRKGEEKRSEKKGAKERRETKRSRYVLFRPRRSAFLLLQPRLNVAEHKSHATTGLSSICICRPEETILSFSLSELQFVPNIRRNIAEIKARCEGAVNLMIARRLYFIYMYI